MSEKAHAVMKDDLAGGKLPSALFGVNAARWVADDNYLGRRIASE